MELTLASWNIHSGIGTDGRFDLHRVGQVLLETGAEVIALQEVGDFLGRTGRDDHPEHLSEQLSMQVAYGANVVGGGGRYGNAILSRLPILSSRNYDLSVKGREARGALRADLDLGRGEVLHVFSLHLGLGSWERRAQENLLLSADILRDATRRYPVVVCGDFNYWWPGSLPALVRRSIGDAAVMLGRREPTFPSRRPLLRLDRFYVDANVRPLSIRAHRSALSRAASDHLPVILRAQTPIAPSIGKRPAELFRQDSVAVRE